MRRIGRVILASAALAAIGLCSSAAFAQEGEVVELERSIIEGERQQAEAFYILDHSELSYEKLQPERTFLPELLESVDDESL